MQKRHWSWCISKSGRWNALSEKYIRSTKQLEKVEQVNEGISSLRRKGKCFEDCEVLQGTVTLSLQELDLALYGLNESDVIDLLNDWSPDLSYLDSLIENEKNRTDLNVLFAQYESFLDLIDYFYSEVQRELPSTSEFPSISSSVSISSSDELPCSESSDQGQVSPSRRGRRRMYFGENRKWATWRNNWVYNQRKQIQSEIKKAELQYLSNTNENLHDELFHLLLEFELVKDKYCSFNQNRIESIIEGQSKSSPICQCRRTGNPCPDLFSVVSPQAQ